MAVNHGGGTNPPEFGMGTLVQIVPKFNNNNIQNSPMHAISTEKFIFFWEAA